MNTALKTSVILSWINLVVSCFFVFAGLMGALGGVVQFGLVFVVLFGAIGLHSYESLRLRNCILYNTPMDKKTPLSLQVMGFIAMFFSFVTTSTGLSTLRHTKEIAKDNGKNIEEMFKLIGKVNPETVVQISSIAMIVFAISILVNVLMSMSLLRWYRTQHQDPDQEQ
jgi:hypothetical protein